MIRLEEELATRALRLSPLDELASNCPPCFGPKVPGKRETEPDVIVCLDGNFQHRRHQAASAAWRGESGVVPSLFISPRLVKIWEQRMRPHPRAGQNNKADQVIVSFFLVKYIVDVTHPDTTLHVGSLQHSAYGCK